MDQENCLKPTLSIGSDKIEIGCKKCKLGIVPVDLKVNDNVCIALDLIENCESYSSINNGVKCLKCKEDMYFNKQT